ncbi:TPA: hypothetical protein ACVOYV_004313 [Vibrio diabolicus]
MKNWLSSNKIYFDTIATFLLGVMAVIVSVAQLNVSQVQTELALSQAELAKSQLKVAQVQVSPQIHVEAEYILDEATGRPTEDRIKISNLGFPLVTASSKSIVFLKAIITEKELPFEQKRLFIALNAYYGAQIVTGSAQGVLFSTYSDNNNSNFGSLLREFMSLSDRNNYNGYIELERYVNVNYSTHMGTTDKLYFKVNMVGGAEKLEAKDGEDIFEFHNSQFPLGKLEDFSTLTSTKLWELIQAQKST